MRVARERRESGALAARGGARRGVRPGCEGDSSWSKGAPRAAPLRRAAPRGCAAGGRLRRARAGRRRCAPAGVTRARTRRAFAGGWRAPRRGAARAPETPRARPSVATQVAAAEQPGEARTSENAAPQKWRAGLAPFYLPRIYFNKANNRHSEPIVFDGPFMFPKHSEHSSAPAESTSGCSCDATVVRDAHPHGQAHTSPQKRGFLRSGHAACALLCVTTAPRVCPPARASVRVSTRAPARVLVTESTCLRV
jgi:hypothetical protein